MNKNKKRRNLQMQQKILKGTYNPPAPLNKPFRRSILDNDYSGEEKQKTKKQSKVFRLFKQQKDLRKAKVKKLNKRMLYI